MKYIKFFPIQFESLISSQKIYKYLKKYSFLINIWIKYKYFIYNYYVLYLLFIRIIFIFCVYFYYISWINTIQLTKMIRCPESIFWCSGDCLFSDCWIGKALLLPTGRLMLLLLLKALISISVTSTPVRTPTNSSQSQTHLQVKSH